MVHKTTGKEQQVDARRTARSADEFIITRGELANVIDVFLWVDKHHSDEFGDTVMDMLNEIRKVLGRDVDGGADTSTGRSVDAGRRGPSRRRRRRPAGGVGVAPAGAGSDGGVSRASVEALIETYGRVVPVAKLKELL